VTYSQTIFLVRLWETDGQSQTDLALSAGLKQPSVVRILDRMERDKLIKRIRNKEDKRIYNFYLTEKGRKACHKLEGHANVMHDVATKDIATNDVTKLNKLLSNIVGNLQIFLAEKLE
jgi:MarR family transcriptional regulator for hemolysin